MKRRKAPIAILILLFSSSVFITGQTNHANGQLNILLSTMPAGKDPQRYKGYIEPRFKALTDRSYYVPMRDGVKIAVQVVLPKDLPADEKIPAILNMTRYWRAHQGDDPNPFFPSHGYACVFVDARGTGASFGVWEAPFS